MPVSQREVDELREAGQAQPLDFSQYALRTTSELFGYMIAEARDMGLDEAQSLDRIELLARAVPIDQQDLREARATLKALNYSPDLIKLLTRLAARAKPKPTWMPPGRAGVSVREAHAAWRDDQPSQIDHTALALVMQPKKRKARR